MSENFLMILMILDETAVFVSWLDGASCSGLIYNNHGSTALSEVTWTAHLWQFGDQPTGRAVQLNPDVTARAIWHAVRRLG